MFAYCKNNPSNCIDTTGNFPWHIVVGGLLGGGLGALATWINGGSGKDILISGVKGTIMGVITAVFPQATVVLLSYEMMVALWDCLYEGYSIEEAFAILMLTGAFECTGIETGDAATDLIVDATFGVGQELIGMGTEKLVQSKSRPKPNEKLVTYSVISMIAAGRGAGGKCNMMEYDYTGRSELWYNP